MDKILTLLLLFTGCDQFTEGPEIELARSSVAVSAAVFSAGHVAFPGPLPLYDKNTMDRGSLPPRTVTGIKWVSWAEAKASKKPSWFHFSGDYCGPCKVLEKEAFTDPAVLRASERYSCVEIRDPKYLRQWKINRIPADVFVNKDWKVVKRSTSPTSRAFASYLEKAVDEK